MTAAQPQPAPFPLPAGVQTDLPVQHPLQPLSGRIGTCGHCRAGRRRGGTGIHGKARTMTDQEFGPWILHDGSGCPQEVQVGRYIQAVTQDYTGGEWNEEGVVHQAAAESPCWWMKEANGDFKRVLRYRLRRSPGVQRLADMIRTVPEEEMV